MGKLRPPQMPFGAILRAAIDNHSVGRRFMLCCEESGEKLSAATTVSFHNFKSQNFKLRISNPKSKHDDHLSVLSRISNCQGLSRKNNFEILKTYRTTRDLILQNKLCHLQSHQQSPKKALIGLRTEHTWLGDKIPPAFFGKNDFLEIPIHSSALCTEVVPGRAQAGSLRERSPFRQHWLRGAVVDLSTTTKSQIL